MTEDVIHRQCVAHMKLLLLPEVLWFHTPNGMRTSKRQAAVHKAMGMMPGVADLLIFADKLPHMAIELKMQGKYLRPTQKTFKARWEETGGLFDVARSVDDLDAILQRWGVPMRGRLT